MGLRPFQYLVIAHWAGYIITFVLLLTSTILLETSLNHRVSDKVLCSEDDISSHYSKSIWAIIVGAIILIHTILEIAFIFGFPVYRNWKDLSSHVKRNYLSRNFKWKIILSDSTFMFLMLLSICAMALPCVLIGRALCDVIGAEWNSNGLVYQANPQSDRCCGSSIYTHGLVPNYTAAHPPCLNFMNEILHCRAPNFSKKSSGLPCCCFEPTRVVSYLNLEAYNILVFCLRVLFWTHLGVGGCFMMMTEIDFERIRRLEQSREYESMGDNFTCTMAHIDINHNQTTDSAAYHVISQREASTVTAGSHPRGVGKFTCAPGQTRDLVKHEILKDRQRQSEDVVHLAYTFHSCTIEYWMELSLQGVSVKGADNVHQIDIQNYLSGTRFFDVIKDSFGGYVVLIISGETVKGLLLATGSNASPNPIRVGMPTVSGAQIEVRAPRMPLPNIFEDRVFSPGEENQRSLKLGDILVECRMDVYLGAVQTFNEIFAGRHTNVKLGVKNYSKNDSIRTEVTNCGRIFMVMKNGECRGIGFIHAPKKVADYVTIQPGKDSTNSEYFVCLNFWDK